MPAKLRLIIWSLLMALIAGCGFQLRGSYSLPYESIYIAGADYSLIVVNLKRAIRIYDWLKFRT